MTQNGHFSQQLYHLLPLIPTLPDQLINQTQNFIWMYDHLEIGFLLDHPRQHRPTRQPDPYAVQPWEKNTLQAQHGDEFFHKKYKTFYQVPPSQPITKVAYSTQRAFSFAKDRQYASKNTQRMANKHPEDKINMPNNFKKSAVSHYNINGNFLTEPSTQRRFSNQFFLRKEKKSTKKLERGGTSDIPVFSLTEMKKRVSFQKQSSFQEDIHFIRFSSEREKEPDRQQKLPSTASNGKQRRKSKIISLGFRKVSTIRSLLKQKSLNIDSFPF